jgi:hypothetical protein
MLPWLRHRIGMHAMSDRYERQSNYGLYEQIVDNVAYAVRARNGSLIPMVPYRAFKIVHAALPEKLWRIQDFRACDGEHVGEGGVWRYSHNNEDGDLPQWEVDGKTYFQESTRDLSVDQHRFQQFQEIDVRALLGIKGDEASKEAADPGAMRVVVDECFQHVYFTLNHYRDIMVSKHAEAVNPWMLVMFDTFYQGWKYAQGGGGETESKSADDTFRLSNITEVSLGPSGKVTAKFGKLTAQVRLLKPKAVFRKRRNSYQFTSGHGFAATTQTYTPPKTG